tara:strand:- start:258 stop:461 length:204 start_codon:yes stop_codon:yes gene_type:complete
MTWKDILKSDSLHIILGRYMDRSKVKEIMSLFDKNPQDAFGKIRNIPNPELQKDLEEYIVLWESLQQ